MLSLEERRLELSQVEGRDYTYGYQWSTSEFGSQQFSMAVRPLKNITAWDPDIPHPDEFR